MPSLPQMLNIKRACGYSRGLSRQYEARSYFVSTVLAYKLIADGRLYKKFDDPFIVIDHLTLFIIYNLK